MKKMFSLALALIMALALCVPAMAVDPDGTGAADDADGKITIANSGDISGDMAPEKEYTAYAYKIFDVTYSEITEDGGNYSYTISSTSPWYATVADYAAVAENGLTLTASVDDTDTVYIISHDSTKFSAPNFAAALYAALKDATDPVVDANAKAFSGGVASGLELGYWFVSSNLGALCNLTTTNNEVTIYDKNEIKFDKEDDKENVEIGETVTYTLNAKVPETDGYTKYIYEIRDTMSAGLTFNKDVVVEIGGETISAADYTIAYAGTEVTNRSGEKETVAENSFYLSLDFLSEALAGNVNEEIEITYTAKVNEDALNVEENGVTLTYSNNPSDEEKTAVIPDVEYVWTAKIQINKINAEDEALEGAKFVLKNSEGEFYKYNAAVEDDPATDDDESADAYVEWVADQADATVGVSDVNGIVDDFIGLLDGTYELIEIEAPTGYNLLAEPVVVTVAVVKENGVPTEKAEVTYKIGNGEDAEESEPIIGAIPEIGVLNLTGAELPSTGGMGTTIFYVVGGVLMAGAAILLVTKKKLANQE